MKTTLLLLERLHITAIWFLSIVCVVFLSSCASIVYKDGATTFLATGRAVSNQLTEASAALAKADDSVKLSRIVTDSTCPIADERLFIRGPDGNFGPAMARFSQLGTEASCRQLVACSTSQITACKTVCFSREESNCLVQLEQNYAIELKNHSHTLPENLALSEEANALAKLLNQIEYRRTTAIENKLVGSTLELLTQYMDLLSKVAENRKSEIPDDSKKLSDNIKKVTDGAERLTGKKLSADTTAQRDKLQKGIGALGKFLGDIDLIVKNSHDSKEVKRLANQNKNTVPQVIEAIKPIFGGDAYLVAAMNNRASMVFRLGVEQRYSQARDEYGRKQMLAEVENYPLNTGNDVEEAVDKVFDALSKSHNSLLALINNPTDDDLKKIRSEQFDTFRILVEDAAGLIASLK